DEEQKGGLYFLYPVYFWLCVSIVVNFAAWVLRQSNYEAPSIVVGILGLVVFGYSFRLLVVRGRQIGRKNREIE
ncbi:TPA: hypothetical protein ACQVHJ_005794, partial [Serratia marcescens]